MPSSLDAKYFGLLAKALTVCRKYKPMFGKGRKGGMTLKEFQELYGADPFYKWVGLDSEMVYAAHKAAGGMTSIYRQLGIGCQWIFSNILQDRLGLSAQQASWTYQVPTSGKKPRKLSLDGRIDFDDVDDEADRRRLQAWTEKAAERLMLPKKSRQEIKGLVFEVRQGYKSMDSKRQNADIANAASAYVNQYIPVLLLLSTQIDKALINRYTQARWLLLVGNTRGDSVQSTYVFCRQVLGYDLGRFFTRHSKRIKAELEKVLKALLKA